VIVFIGIATLKLLVGLVLAIFAQILYNSADGYNVVSISVEVWLSFSITFLFLLGGVVAAVLYLKDYFIPYELRYPPCCCGDCV